MRAVPALYDGRRRVHLLQIRELKQIIYCKHNFVLGAFNNNNNVIIGLFERFIYANLRNGLTDLYEVSLCYFGKLPLSVCFNLFEFINQKLYLFIY